MDVDAGGGVTVLVYLTILSMLSPGTDGENLSRKSMSPPRFEPGTYQNVTV